MTRRSALFRQFVFRHFLAASVLVLASADVALAQAEGSAIPAIPNAAIVYATTAAYFGTRLAGAPPVGPGNGQPVVPTTEQIVELQRLMIARKMLTGEADGRLGSATRTAVKQAQLKVGLPADAYPTAELIERLKTAR